jgi:hypothetical protein
MKKPKAGLEVLFLSFVRSEIAMCIYPYGNTIPYSYPLDKILFAIPAQHVPKCIPVTEKHHKYIIPLKSYSFKFL